MPRPRPTRLQHLTGIGVDRMGNLGDSSTNSSDLLRLENLDIDVPPDPIVVETTAASAAEDDDNSYLPFIGQLELRNVAAKHVSAMTGGAVDYDGQRNCVISAGGLSGILNVLLATVEVGDGVLVTDPTYIGLINRIRLAGAEPRFVPFLFEPAKTWKLDLDALKKVVETKHNKVSAMLLMSPSLPSGGYLDEEDWKAVADLCVKHDLLLIYDSAMERLLFDDRKVIHPAAFPGWRVGWTVGPEELMLDIAKVGMANVVVPVGIAQRATAKALENSQATIGTWSAELQSRRDVIIKELEGLPFGVPAGGLAMCLRVDDFGLSGEEASKRLLEQGVCATAMTGWGEKHGAQYIRIVYSNEPVSRLKGLGRKVRIAFDIHK